jgi:hypothetical protein
MKRSGFVIGLIAFVVASTATAQSPSSRYEGLHFSVAAPQGAAWRLSCRFPPVRMMGVGLVNRFDLEGQGPQRGRLPSQSGWCDITRTSGAGAVALAVVKDGQAVTAATIQTDQPARLNAL